MKRRLLLLSVLIISSIILCGCYFDLNEILNPDKIVKFEWPESELSSAVPEYTEGRICEATVVEATEEDKGMVRIRVEKTGKGEYKKYIQKLKDAGFLFCDTTGNGNAENLELDENTKTINWSGSKGDVYISTMYVDKKSKYIENYRCDVMITIYPERPASWAD